MTDPPEVLGYEETWTCEVTPNDSEDDGASGTASFYIEGAPACTGEDQTSIDYPHFGNGTAAPAFDDQRHLSGSIMEGWHKKVRLKNLKKFHLLFQQSCKIPQ